MSKISNVNTDKMKNSRKLSVQGISRISFVLFSLLLLVITSCETMPKDVIGEWKVYNAEFVEGRLAQRDEEEVLRGIIGSKYNFHKDGSVAFSDNYMNERNGKWSLDRDMINIEYELVENYFSEHGDRVLRSNLKIMTTDIGKMSVQETFGTGRVMIYYLERVD